MMKRLIQWGTGLLCTLVAVAAGAQSAMQQSPSAGAQGMQPPSAGAQNAMPQPSAANIPTQGQLQRIDVSQMMRGQPIQVADEFNNRTPDGCQLHTMVNGTLQTYLPPGAAPNAPASAFVPNLQIRTNLQCQSGGRFNSTAQLTGPAMSQGQLEKALTQIARAVTPSGNQLCNLAAGFQFAAGRLASTTLVRDCMPAVGGGPWSDQAPMQGIDQGMIQGAQPQGISQPGTNLAPVPGAQQGVQPVK